MEREISSFVGSRIRDIRKKRKLTQKELGEMIGVKHNTISSYEKGTNEPEQNILFKLADSLNVSINDFFPYSEKLEVSQSNEYPYYPTSISAGLPLTVDGTDATTISISDEVMGKYKNDKSVFFARINGDSMNNIMDDGTLIAIKPTPIETLQNGDIVVFSTEHEYSVKHIYKTPQAIIFKPNSTNDCHHEQHFSYDDEITIHGKVITYIINLD